MQEMPSLRVITPRSMSTHEEEVGMTTPTTVDQLTLESINAPEWSQLNPEHSEVHDKKRISMTSPRTPPATITTPRRTSMQQDQEEAMDLVSWQSVHDLPERRLMVQRIMVMTEKKRLASSRSRTSTSRRAQAESASALAKRIELSLYSRAGSMHEYKNLNTLHRRLQSLVTLSFHEASAMRSPTAAFQAGKRKFPARNLNTWATCSNNKKRRVVMMTTAAATNTLPTTTLLFASTNQDTLGLVFSFLKGTEVLRLRSLNRFAADVLPTCVRSLEVELTQFKQAFAKNEPIELMKSMTNLEQLGIYRKKNPQSMEMTNQSLHAWGCMELDVAQENSGETIVNQLAHAMEEGACRRLRKLQLVSIFANTTKRNAIGSLCMALSHGSCSQMEDLLLGGNSISDVGTVDIARMLKAGTMPNLARLDLRRNYIGETGLNRIMSALALGKTKNLKFLCMGGNIIADNCVEPLKKMLASFTCPQMRFLGLEDNFLSPQGVQMIIQAAVVGGMVPKLHRVPSRGGGAPVTTTQATLAHPVHQVRGLSITQSRR